MTNKKFYHKLLSVLLCLAMVLSYIPVMAATAVTTGSTMDYVASSKKSDPGTLNNWEKYFGPNVLSTEYSGAVWTDKSVFTSATAELPGATLTDSNNFLVALSAIAANHSIKGHTSSPTDTMLVLDVSGSMVDGTTSIGYTRWYNNYQETYAIDMSLINAMVKATNDTIQTLMEQNTNNRVGVVLYSGNSSTNQDADYDDATVVLPLGRYTGVNGEFLSVDANTTTSQLYTRQGYRWVSAGTSDPYVPTGTPVYVETVSGLKTEAGATVSATSKYVNGGTYIQNGLYKAMEQFLAVTDTAVPEGKAQAGAERLPVVVLMSDGAPTIANTDYYNTKDSDSNTGNGGSTSNRITFLTQLTAAYVRGQIAAKYQENNTDEKEALFLTLGLGTENSTAATDTLYPAGSDDPLTTYWSNYLAGSAGSNVSVGDNLTVRREAAVEAMNYVDKYFYATNAQDLINSFKDILGEIELKAETYTTLVEGGNADFSGYVSFEDELGELMQVYNVNGILVGNSLLTGEELAKGMTDGNLGTVTGPTAKGDELVATVKERIPGTSTTQAQQLIDNAYNDHQLFYDTTTGEWSNYIGWYADADGNYAGFWDKDSGYENAPANAVYANRSYGYLGASKSSDMMHTVVMVRTNLKTLHQTVHFRVPAALLPTVQYRITLDENDPSKVTDFVREGAEPIRLVFEVGVRSDINAVNMEKKIAEHLAKGNTHVHRNDTTGAVTFYTNEFSVGNDLNGNKIPDANEIDSAVVAESHFHPAMDNSRFYYTEDTDILDASGNAVTGSARPTDLDGTDNYTTGYYYTRYVYTDSGRTAIQTPIAAATLASNAQYADGRWYIPAGTMYHNLARFKVDKVNPQTNTLYYSFFPAAFDGAGKQDVYAFLGNNGSITATPASGFVLSKQVQGTIPGVSQYTFRVTLSDTSATPVLTDANGDPLTGVTMSSVTNGQFTVTMPAGVEAYISGIDASTAVTVEEVIDGDYKVVDIQVNGQRQTGSASFTVPAYSAGNSQMVPVTFTNAPKGYGDLVISKDVHHNLASDPDALATKEFSFDVTLTGSELKAGNTYTTSQAGTTVQVVTDGIATFSVKLHNEESITVYDLPEGTGYTVTETAIPDGFTVNQNDLTGQIEADHTVTAGFVNTFDFDAVQVDLNLIINKDLTGTPPVPEIFTFELQQLIAGETDPRHIKTYTIASDAANKVATDTLDLPFNAPGIYNYQLVEKAPQTPTNGMTYSTVRAQFEVTVTDSDMDGKLEIAIRDAAHMDNVSAVYGVSGDPETVTGITAEATFANTYQANSTSFSVDVQKILTNNTGVEIPLTNFRFALYAADANGNAVGTALQTVTSNALGKATFNLPVTALADLKYVIKEVIPAEASLINGKYVKDGMTYDASEYILDVAVTDNAGQLVATPTLTLKGGSAPVGTANFENTYDLGSVPATVTVEKVLTGRAKENSDHFSALLERTDDTFVPYPDGNANHWFNYEPLQINKTSSIAIGVFTRVGSYHYKLTEGIPSDAAVDPLTGKYVRDGITYDPAQYHITVTVFDNGDGTLAANTVIHKLGQTAPVTTAGFTNTYTVTGEGSATFSGKKNLSGRALVAGEFTIGLYSDAACTTLIESVTNNADGTFSFSTIDYTVADLGAGNAEKVYTYYVKEINDGKGGVTYDPNTYTVTVTVSHDKGVLTVTPSANAASLQINNTYKAEDVTATINGSKVLSGDWSKVTGKDFTFHLYKADASFNITDHNPVKTATVTGNQDFSMTLEYKDSVNGTGGDEGYHYYVLKEVIPDPKAGGIGYDAGAYHITVNVSDPGNGKLAAMMTMYRPGTGNTDTATFTNTYSVAPTTITLTGSKRYINSATNQPIAMNEGDFTFLVLDENDAVAATGYNKANGTIEFTEITYTAPGVHNYTMAEEDGGMGGVVYDLNTSFTVTVTVTDNGDGTLTAAADYNGATVAFENKYAPESAKVSLAGSKLFSGDWSKVANKIFSFSLYETGSTFDITGITPVEKSNDASGSIPFGTLTFDKTGTYYYYLVEKDPALADKGITGNDTYYKITVTVTDRSGKLIPAVRIDTNAGTAPAVAVNGTTAAVTGLNFTNTYTAKPVTYTPKAEKEYKGDSMKTFDFVLSGGGFAEQTKQNGTDGKVTFDTLTFDRAGSYELTVREKKNALWGFIRWDVNVYKLTVLVTDDGEGQLHIDSVTVTSTLGSDDLVFHNTHEDLITKKDVFLYSAPTVSIDGKKVQIGDELVYTVSYTNHTGKAVTKVTVTDTLPKSLSYVEGSADKGGSFANGTVSWQLTNVPAGETVTVSFRAKVANTDTAVSNTATVVDDENTYTTNEVTNSVTNDTLTKTVAKAEAPTVSIDGQKVAVGDVLLYTITYVNGDDQAAKVTITDTLSQYVVYVDGSADNSGVHANGTVAWTLELAAGESKTVTFKAMVKDAGATVVNQAQAYDGVNKIASNTVTAYTPAPPATPQTGDEMHLVLWLSLLLISAAGMAVLVVSRKRIFN